MTSCRGHILLVALLVALLVTAAPAHAVERITHTTDGAAPNGTSMVGPKQPMSADGRFVVFSSRATNLVEGDTNDAEDVFVYDREAGTTERVSVSSGGTQG